MILILEYTITDENKNRTNVRQILTRIMHSMRCCFDVPAPLAQFSNILELCRLDKLDEAYACFHTDIIQASWVIHSFVEGTPRPDTSFID